MRICYLANAQSVHTQKWVQSFVQRGHNVHVISFEDAAIQGATVHVIRLPLLVRNASFAFKLAAVRLIKRLLKKIQPDILHAHYVTNYGLFAALSGFHPFVLTAWGSDLKAATESKLISKIKKPLATYALRKADLITTDAEHMKQTITRYGVDAEKVKIICFGIDTNLFKPNGDKPAKPTVISMRSLERKYNLETLLEAVKQIEDAHLIVVGDGSQRNSLIAHAQGLGLSGRATFLGQIPNRMLPSWLCRSSVYVSTSLSDAGISASTAEAMACELPVIVSDVGENNQWVEPNCLFPPRNSQVLANKIVYFLAHEHVSRRMGRNNRRTIIERNNIHAEMEKMEQLYEWLIQ